MFEGLRAALVGHVFRADLMFDALGINLGPLALGVVVLLKLLDSARAAGSFRHASHVCYTFCDIDWR